MLRLYTVALMGLLLLAACAKPITSAPKLDQAQLEAERRAQQQLLSHQHGDPEAVKLQPAHVIEARLKRVAKRIGQSGTSTCWQMFDNNQPCSYGFVLTQDPEEDVLNAWADGKAVYITPTMVSFAATDEELANILAHEYAHNILSHPQSTMQNVTAGAVGGMLLDVLAKSQGFDTGGQLTQLGSTAGQLQYSIPFEKEADYVGLYILARAGYNVNGANDFWRKFTIQTGGGVEGSVTHPSNPERTLSMKKTAAEIEAKKANGQVLLPNLRPQ